MNRVAGLVICLVMFSVSLSGCSERRSEKTRLAPSEVAKEVRSALAEPAYLDRNTRLASALRQLDPDNVDAVADVYTELLKDIEESEVQPFFDAWAGFDAPAAFGYAMQIPYDGISQRAQRSAIYAWAIRDALAASVAADQAAEKRRRNGLMFYQALVEGWAISGQGGLQDYIVAGRSAEDPGQLILAAQPKIYLRDGADGLLEWSEEIMEAATETGPRMKAFRYAVRTAGFRDPHAAIPFVLRHYGEDYAEQGPRVLVETWMQKEPEPALEWLRSEAPESARAAALGIAVTSWLYRDMNAARSWLDSVPVGDPYYQPAFDSLANRIAKHAPRKAIEWCRRGQTPEINRTCLRQVAIAWYKEDPISAGLWMENESGLPAEDLVSVRQRAKQGR